MKLAYTMAPGRGDTDLVLERLAKDLVARGLRCRGTVPINCERAGAGPCDMDVRVLPDGPVLRISRISGRRRGAAASIRPHWKRRWAWWRRGCPRAPTF